MNFSENWNLTIFAAGSKRFTPERTGAFLRYTIPGDAGSIYLPLRIGVVHAVRIRGNKMMKVVLQEEEMLINFSLNRMVKSSIDPDITAEDTIVLLALSAL